MSSLFTPSSAAVKGITIREVTDYAAQVRDVIGGASISRGGTSATSGADDWGKGVTTEVIPPDVDSDEDNPPPPSPMTGGASTCYSIPP